MSVYTCDPNTKLLGASAQALLHSILSDDFAAIVEKHGFSEIDPDQWYPLCEIFQVLSEISELPGATMDMVSIGMAAAELSPLPPQVEAMTADAFYPLYQQIYQQRHRGGHAGGLNVTVHSPQIVTIQADSPYPDDLLYGLMYGFARRFAHGQSFTVTYDEDEPRRERGGTQTIIHVVYDA